MLDNGQAGTTARYVTYGTYAVGVIGIAFALGKIRRGRGTTTPGQQNVAPATSGVPLTPAALVPPLLDSGTTSPTGLMVVAATETTITLAWVPPSSSRVRNQVIGYREINGAWKNVGVARGTGMYTLSRLRRATTYELHIQANVTGVGATFSTSVNGSTTGTKNALAPAMSRAGIVTAAMNPPAGIDAAVPAPSVPSIVPPTYTAGQ